MAQTQDKELGRIVAENVGVTVPAAGNTPILEVIVDDLAFLGVSIAVATQNLDAFIVQARMSPNDSYQTIRSVAADYTTPAGIVIDASGDLTVQAAGSSGWLALNVTPFHSIRILASAAADSASVTARAIGKG